MAAINFHKYARDDSVDDTCCIDAMFFNARFQPSPCIAGDFRSTKGSKMSPEKGRRGTVPIEIDECAEFNALNTHQKQTKAQAEIHCNAMSSGAETTCAGSHLSKHVSGSRKNKSKEHGKNTCIGFEEEQIEGTRQKSQ